MSETSVRNLINRATSTTESSPGGSRLLKREIKEAWEAAKAPEPGDPAGKPITAGEAAVFQGLVDCDMSRGARRRLDKILGEIPALLQDGPVPVTPLPAKRGHQVFLTPDAGLAVDASGTAPANQLELCKSLYDAGEWIQASFGTDDNVFERAALSHEGKRAVLQQSEAAIGTNLDELNHQQVDQFLGSACAVLVELLKSVKTPTVPGPGRAEADRELRAEIFTVLHKALLHSRTNVRIRRAMVGYMHKSAELQALLDPTQKATVAELYRADHPQQPFAYDQWEREQKSLIRIDHACGVGEGFLYGFVKQLMERGLRRDQGSGYELERVSGDGARGPADLRVTIPTGDPMNAWGRDMSVEIHVRQYASDMYEAMGDPNVDIVSYGGHSDFGGNTLESLERAPQQVGDKVICRDLCCGIDTTNAEARVYPLGSNNSITSVNSSYFRTRDDPQVGKYAYDSEGYHMLMATVRGVLGKKDWQSIGRDLEREANWYGHDSANNWIFPGDPRRDGARDDDSDGIPNVFDVMPGVNTTDIPASVAREFELKLPGVPATDLGAARAFQALQFVNTATNYNTELDALNSQRKLCPHPQGLWFDGDEEPRTYVRITPGKGGRFYVQLNSALSAMTMESMRAVLFFETARFFAEQNPSHLPSQRDKVAMALLFASASLVYDQAWRDEPVFEGLRRLYGIPDSVDFSVLRSAVYACEGRHNYTGDMTALADVLAATGDSLSQPGVGEPAIEVTA